MNSYGLCIGAALAQDQGLTEEKRWASRFGGMPLHDMTEVKKWGGKMMGFHDMTEVKRGPNWGGRMSGFHDMTEVKKAPGWGGRMAGFHDMTEVKRGWGNKMMGFHDMTEVKRGWGNKMMNFHDMTEVKRADTAAPDGADEFSDEQETEKRMAYARVGKRAPVARFG